ncbi:unnamed protein product, partial [Meganyctiphanes norvegica]
MAIQVLGIRLHRPSLLLLLLVLLLTGAGTQADYGQTCEDLMEDTDGDSHYKCGPRGQVMCQEGWGGDLCNIPKCRQDCHPLHGYCQVPGECKCALGWRGDRCDRCTPLPGCQHGFCNSTSYECICEEGWDGLFCNQPSCREGCHNTRGYCEAPGECKCRIGWGGNTCEECKPLPGCINGYCTKPLECKCHEGWTGPLCEIPICATNCSTSHGSCFKPGECRCEVGWWGDTCNECFAYPGCQHGYCTKPWECVCEEEWEGMTCDKRSKRKTSFCDRNPSACLNGGTCINVPSNKNFTCSCPSLFTGQRCDYLADSPFTTSTTLPTLPTTTPVITTPANAQVVTTDAISPMGKYSLVVQQNTNPTTPRAANEVKRPYEDPDKLNRKIFLQNNARITFRSPKISSAEDSNGNKVPLKVIDRQLLPLPVYLPRVHEVITNKQLQIDEGREPTPIYLFDVGNEESFELERNQISENRRFLRHQEESPDYVLTDLVEAESNEKRRPIHQRIVRVNSFNRPFLVSAGATALPRANPFSISTIRQPATAKPKQLDLMHTSAESKPTTSTIPKTTPTMPVTTISSIPKTTHKSQATTILRTEFIEEEDIFETQESVLQPQVKAKPDHPDLKENKSVLQVHNDEFMGGGVHIGAHFAPHENKAFHEAFIELRKV